MLYGQVKIVCLLTHKSQSINERGSVGNWLNLNLKSAFDGPKVLAHIGKKTRIQCVRGVLRSRHAPAHGVFHTNEINIYCS